MKNAATLILLCVPMAAGCVSKSTHTDTLAQLEEARTVGLKNAEAFEKFKKQAAADVDSQRQQLSRQIDGLNQDKTSLSDELNTTQQALAHEKQEREATQRNLENEQERQRNAVKQFEQTQDEHQRLEQANIQLDQERNRLKTAADASQGQVDDLRRQMASAKSDLANADSRYAVLQKEREQLAADLDGARNHAKELSGKLSAEQQAAGALRDDKQRLLGAMAASQEELARLQKRSGDVESQFTEQLSDRDREINRLKQIAAERDALKGQVATLSNDIEHHRQRAAMVSGNLDALEAEAERLRQERDRFAADLHQHQDLLKAAEPKLASLNSTVTERDQELDRVRRDQDRLQELLRQEQDRLKQEAADKQRLEQERAAKEAEIERLTKTHEDLTKSLKDDIEKGNITIRQVRDQLTINMVDRVLFDSGKADIKPEGLKVLKQVGDVLKHVADKQIRIEGHTDNVPIGPKIKDRFPTNWELSTARATSVIRYLIEEGGVDRTAISAGGYADTRPGASNETEEGRASNRRIEIVLYPKDLGAIVSRISQ
jgi:chemotaxis protein MotB